MYRAFAGQWAVRIGLEVKSKPERDFVGVVLSSEVLLDTADDAAHIVGSYR
jgi:hypothetical protein